MDINQLPVEILDEILSYLTIKEKFRCERVCRLWQETIFNSIDVLTFEQFDKEFHQQQKHKHKYVVSKENVLSTEVNNDDEAMKTIISKCGKNLRSICGFVSVAIEQMIVKFCEQLICIDMLFDNVESLKCIGETYGKQLTCATLYDNMKDGIPQFITACSNLSSLAVISSLSVKSDIPVFNSNSSLELFNANIEDPKLPNGLSFLTNLVLEVRHNFTEETLGVLLLFTKLEKVIVAMTHQLNKSELWKSVLASWSNLKFLSLEIVDAKCIHFNPLPSNLEYLSLRVSHSTNLEQACEAPIEFITFLPNLKILKIREIGMNSNKLSSFLENIVCNFPALDELSLKYQQIPSQVMDEQLAPLLSMSTLKTLSLGITFDITDEFASKLLTELHLLTSFGTRTHCNEDANFGNILPCGPLFMKALIRKASNHPANIFFFTGETKGIMSLHHSLPPNLFLCFQYNASVHLTHGFGGSTSWQELVERACDLSSLNVVVEDDVNLNVSALPKSARHITLIGLNNIKLEDGGLLTFHCVLPNLTHLNVYHRVLTNRQLGAVVKCISQFCPNLLSLCLDRGNANFDPVDGYLSELFSHKSLYSLCFTEKFVITDEFSSNLVNKLENLRCFGCENIHTLGIQCGPLFLDAVLLKTLIGQHVVINGGPTQSEVLKALKIKKIPDLLSIFPRQQKLKKQTHCQIA